jgi:hypothetical protein
MSQTTGTVDGTVYPDEIAEVFAEIEFYGKSVKVNRLELHEEFVSLSKGVSVAMADWSVVMTDCMESRVYEVVIDPKTGQYYKTWDDYFVDIVGEDKNLKLLALKANIVKMHAAGLSYRKMEAASGKSRGYIADVIAEAEGKPKRTRKARQNVPDAPEADVPKVDVPTVDVPDEADVPKADVPTVDVPTVDAPPMTTPADPNAIGSALVDSAIDRLTAVIAFDLMALSAGDRIRLLDALKVTARKLAETEKVIATAAKADAAKADAAKADAAKADA